MSFAIAATAVYGDLLKRVMPSTAALLAVYAISAVIIAVMLTTGRRGPRAGAPLISILAGALILTYLLQFLTGFSVDLLPASMMLFYVAIPLAFITAIPRAYPEFDLRALALSTTVLMVPIHAVGLVQHFVDSSFLVSTAYSEMGGVIARNFLDGTGAFNRLPSLFASADRYAGVSAMQLLLSFLLLTRAGPRIRSSMPLLAFSVMSAAVGLLIAGARSRILIASVALLVGGIALLVNIARGRMSVHGRAIIARGALAAAAALAAALAVALTVEEVRDRIAELPVLSMLAQTVEQGDAQGRFGHGLEISAMPDEVSFFGQGLGTSADGRPGEFGIRALWIEGGFFWTTIMLIIHAAFLMLFVRSIVGATLAGDALASLLLTGGALFWLFGLLAGLSSSFELSLALLLFPTIAVAAKGRVARSTGEARREEWGSRGRDRR